MCFLFCSVRSLVHTSQYGVLRRVAALWGFGPLTSTVTWAPLGGLQGIESGSHCLLLLKILVARACTMLKFCSLSRSKIVQSFSGWGLRPVSKVLPLCSCPIPSPFTAFFKNYWWFCNTHRAISCNTPMHSSHPA